MYIVTTTFVVLVLVQVVEGRRATPAHLLLFVSAFDPVDSVIIVVAGECCVVLHFRKRLFLRNFLVVVLPVQFVHVVLVIFHLTHRWFLGYGRQMAARSLLDLVFLHIDRRRLTIHTVAFRVHAGSLHHGDILVVIDPAHRVALVAAATVDGFQIALLIHTVPVDTADVTTDARVGHEATLALRSGLVMDVVVLPCKEGNTAVLATCKIQCLHTVAYNNQSLQDSAIAKFSVEFRFDRGSTEFHGNT